MRVLFIGNSFIEYSGGLGNIAAELARSAGVKRAPIFEQSTKPFLTLKEQWETTPARARIGEGAWDFVVIQPHMREPMDDPQEMTRLAGMFDAEIRAAGARTVLFETWVYKTNPEQQPDVTQAFQATAASLDADPRNKAINRRVLLARVGEAWSRSLARRPDIRLHFKDNGHPDPAGSYLTACVFYSCFYQRSPVGLPARLFTGGKLWIDLNSDWAGSLQQTAWEATR